MASLEISSSGKAPEKAAAAAAAAPRFAPVGDVVLRFMLFASSMVAVVVMRTARQTENIAIPVPPFQISRSAQFDHSPALIYFVAALSVAVGYGLITTLVSLYSLLNHGRCAKALSHFVIYDVLLLGIVAAATGAGGADAYIGLKGNSHTRWMKICDRYDVFCKHIASSLAFSLFGSIVLVLLILLSVYSLSKKIPKQSSR